MRLVHTVMNNHFISKNFNSYWQKPWLAHSVLSQQLPNKLDSVIRSSTDVCCLLKAQMTLIGKMSQKLRESLIIRVVYLFSACSHYVKQHFRWAKDSAVVLRSAVSLVLSWEAAYLAFMLYETPSPPHLHETFLSELTNEAEPGVNQLWGLKCASEGLQANLCCLPIQHSHVFVHPSASLFSTSFKLQQP